MTYTLWVFTVPQLTPFFPSPPGVVAGMGAFSSREQERTAAAAVGYGGLLL